MLTSAVVVGHAYKFRSGSMAVALEWCSHLDVASKAEIGKVRKLMCLLVLFQLNHAIN